MKRKNGKWRRIRAFMMGFMNPAVYFWMMHKSVCPVEVGIVKKYEKKYLSDTPK
jgi:hypothetical protein